MEQFINGRTACLEQALVKAIAVKKEKVRDNYAAILTESLSDAQAVSYISFAAIKMALDIAPGPAGKTVVSGLMLLAAVPVIWSLIAESRKDKKDYDILRAVLSAYKESGDDEILQSTKVFVKLHSVPQEKAQEESGVDIREVRLIYNKIPPHILELINNAKAGTANDNKGAKPAGITLGVSALKMLFNSFAFAIRSCSTELGQTARTVGGALRDVKNLAGRDFKRVWKQASGKTLLESKGELAASLKGSPYLCPDQVKAMIAPHMTLAESLHPLQDDLRTNARMRLGTAAGIAACSSFITLACLNAGLALAGGMMGAAAGYIGLSVLLSIPPLRVLCERQHELARMDRDKTTQILEKMSPA